MRPINLAPLALSVLLAACSAGAAPAPAWPEWQEFAKRFVEPDGRVVDLTFEQKTTSEGQSYGLFFALVANDRRRFDSILRWTSDNLAQGRLGRRLPAWHWGKRDDDSWGVKDENPASDADLWLAYALLEAARLWSEPRYAKIGHDLLEQVARHETAQAGSIGPVLLPGPHGFVLEGNRYRVDPSYLPGFQFDYFAAAAPDGPWKEIWDTYVKLAPKVYAAGMAPDLFIVDASGRILPDTDRPEGAYDAIRVYLWAGMSGDSSASLLPLLAPFAALTRERGAPPEKVDTRTRAVLSGDFSPIGFSGAMLPYLKAVGENEALQEQLSRLKVAQLKARLGGTTHYYDECLILFGKGWLDGHYGFGPQGHLITRWDSGSGSKS